MKKILGLDLCVASIGWAIIQRPEDNNSTAHILGMGVRVIPLSECYIEEFNRYWDRQVIEYPDILTEKRKLRIRDRIIFYQRKLKSQKGLVSKCALEPNLHVAPKSPPLFQVGKNWRQGIHLVQ